jgi:hypothetical protein
MTRNIFVTYSCHLLQSFGDSTNTFHILSALCTGRRVTSPQQVIDALEYHPIPPTDLPDSSDIDYASLECMWQISLARYLRGRGHPSGQGLEADVDGNATIRSRMFLRTITGSEYLPTGSTKIKVCSITFPHCTTDI